MVKALKKKNNMKSKKGPFKMKKPSALKFFGMSPKYQYLPPGFKPKGLPGYATRKGNQKSHIKRKGLGNRILRALGL